MVKSLENLLTLVVAMLLAASLVAYYLTRDSAKPATRQSTAAEQALVDTSLLQTAVKLAEAAVTPDEQAQAREAWRLADHELDLRYAAAMRDAQAEAAQPVAGPLKQLSDRITQLQAVVDGDKKRVDGLTKGGGEGLEQAQAQLDLDQDELDDAQQELAREATSEPSWGAWCRSTKHRTRWPTRC
jgi:hypothetical protein